MRKKNALIIPIITDKRWEKRIEDDIPVEVVLGDQQRLELVIITPKREPGDIRCIQDSTNLQMYSIKLAKRFASMTFGISIGLWIFSIDYAMSTVFMLMSLVCSMLGFRSYMLLQEERLSNGAQISRDMAETILLQEQQLMEKEYEVAQANLFLRELQEERWLRGIAKL